MTKKILVINTGGTFNKIYDEIDGILKVPKNNKALKQIFQISKISNIKIVGMLYKDSLDLTKKDRKQLLAYILKSNYSKIIIVHGTDTMNETASFLAKHIKNKTIILTGSMKPFEIEPIEATSNLLSAFGFLTNSKKKNIYISMHGLIKKHTKIKKDKKRKIFIFARS
jgi:L-asparaginase